MPSLSKPSSSATLASAAEVARDAGARVRARVTDLGDAAQHLAADLGTDQLVDRVSALADEARAQVPEADEVRTAIDGAVAALRRLLRTAAHLPGFAGGFLTWLSSALLRLSDLGSQAADRIAHDAPAVRSRRRRDLTRSAALVGAGAAAGAAVGYVVGTRRAAAGHADHDADAPVTATAGTPAPSPTVLAVSPSSPGPDVDLTDPAGSPYGVEAAVIDAGRNASA
ncbi:MAG: hypothetical protein ACLGIR_11075 [Actinomycetes bacterium]